MDARGHQSRDRALQARGGTDQTAELGTEGGRRGESELRRDPVGGKTPIAQQHLGPERGCW